MAHPRSDDHGYLSALQPLAEAAAPWLENASLYDMVEVFKVMAEAHGLERLDAVRVALMVLLAPYMDGGLSQKLVEQLTPPLLCQSGEEPAPEAVHQRLKAEGLEVATANVLQVLIFGGVLSKGRLCRAFRAGEYTSPPTRLISLLQWASDTRDEPGDGEACSQISSELERGEAGNGPQERKLWMPVATHATTWQPEHAVPVLNVELAATGGENVVVLDGLVDEATRGALHSLMTAGCRHILRPKRARSEAASVASCSTAVEQWLEPPVGVWQRTTVDGAGLPRSWGMAPQLLRRLERSPPLAIVEVQSRLAALYPEYVIAHMPDAFGKEDPSNCTCPALGKERIHIEGHTAQGEGGVTDDCKRNEDGNGASGSPDAVHASSAPAYTCTPFVANAAVPSHSFEWHVDADPSSFPDGSAWVRTHGDYLNGAVGKPLFVSLLVYTDGTWQRDWHAETLFLQPEKGVGIFVQPRPARAVLMHQDAFHRVSQPSSSAHRPRYSLVWKLLFIPRTGQLGRKEEQPRGALGGSHETISRPEWGPPLLFSPRCNSADCGRQRDQN